MKPALINAITPLFIAAIGGVIGLGAVLVPNLEEAQRTAAMGLAGTAIAGAAGLAQSATGPTQSPQNDLSIGSSPAVNLEPSLH